MKNKSISKITFNELFNFFSATSDIKYQLTSEIGSGTLYTFKIEKGLRINIWDCFFKNEIELYNEPLAEKHSNFFTIVFLLDKKGLNYVRTNGHCKKNLWWDNIFLSALSDYAISFYSQKRFYCLSINFSYDWFVNVVKNNICYKNVIKKLCTPDNIFLFGKIENQELERIEKLIFNTKDCHGCFFIKAGVLNIVSDFLLKLEEQSSFFTRGPGSTDVVSEVAAYLEKHILEPLPNLKLLAHKYFISESTLKRQFKKHYGVSMSTYFSSRKLEHMQQLSELNHNNSDLLPANLKISGSLPNTGEAAYAI